MIRERHTSLPIFFLLGLTVFIYHFGIGIYHALGLEPLPAFEFLYRSAFLCGVVWWLQAEARRSAVAPIYCLGLLVGMGWPIMIPYHLFKTRGARGLIPLLGLIGSWLVGHLLAVAVYMTFWE